MIADLVDEQYATVERLKAEPRCGEDFCDRCGDCLHCYVEDDCPGRFLHTWVVYSEDVDVWRAAHPEGELISTPTGDRP